MEIDPLFSPSLLSSCESSIEIRIIRVMVCDILVFYSINKKISRYVLSFAKHFCIGCCNLQQSVARIRKITLDFNSAGEVLLGITVSCTGRCPQEVGPKFVRIREDSMRLFISSQVLGYESWRQMYIRRPHPIFDGIYIAKTSYVRQVTFWYKLTSFSLIRVVIDEHVP